MNHQPLLEGLLEGFRRQGQPIALAELAGHLLAAPAPIPGSLARRLVAAALGRPADSLADPLPAAELVAEGPAADPETPLEAACFAVVDLETTGLSPRRAEILEIGAVRIERLGVADRFTTLVDPGGPVPARITQLTGITPAMVRGAPPPDRALRRFRAWLGLAPAAPFVAHNARFDEGFVRRGLARHGLADLDGPVLCTRALARRVAPELGRFSLDHLCDGLGIANAARHRALGDAEATALALLELLRRARRRLGLRTLGELVALQARAPARRPRRGARRPAPERHQTE